MSFLTSGLTRSKRAAALLAAASVFSYALAPIAALGSSHREAPMISQDASVDSTDFYMFKSPSDPTKLVFVANSYPFHYPEGGPNYFRFADDAVYTVHVDNNGNAEEDITYAFKFKTKVANLNTFLFNTQPLTVASPNANVTQEWTAFRIKGKFTGSNSQMKAANVVATGKIAPPVIGNRSIPDYNAVANLAIVDAGVKGKFFLGERDDPFFVDLKVFDLLNLGSGRDTLLGANVNSIVFEVPISSLVTNDPVIGAWSATYRPALRIFPGDGVQKNSTTFVQVSRLGMPLVNEVVVPLGAKDYFNNSKPKDDAGKNFEAYSAVVLKPELANLFKVVLGLSNTPTENRTDLVTVFLTGVPDLNKPANVRPAEMLRVNTSTALSATENRLGVFGGDTAGFPNGRRLADDVVDIEIQAVAGKLAGVTVDPGLGDGVNTNDKAFTQTFPYVASPHLLKL